MSGCVAGNMDTNHHHPIYLQKFEPKMESPNYRPHLVHGDPDRGYSFSTAGTPTGPNFSTKGSIYDGYEAFAEASFGDETAAWMKASVHPQEYPYMSGIPLLNREFRPRNSQITSRYMDDVDGGDLLEKNRRLPGEEHGKFIERPEIPEVYKEQFPAEFFSAERVAPMMNCYADGDMVLARHFQGCPSLPVPPLSGKELEYKPKQPTNTDPEAAAFNQDRVLFGAGMGWWKWKIICDKPLDMPTRASFREHELGHASFRGRLRDNLPYGNMDSWAMAKSAETLLDLSANTGLEIGVRGDGKLYRCIITSGNTEAGYIEYVAEIPAKASANKWKVLQLPWKAFKPCFKGGKITGVHVRQVPPLDPSQITSIGFGVGDRQWGTFVLEVELIRAAVF